jgi:hypothetical protein
MLIFRPKLPVTEEEQQWIDEGFARLEKMMGRKRMLRAQVILPSPQHFPDRYDRTPETAELLFQRVCAYMEVERRGIEFEVFPDETEEMRSVLPYWRASSGGCAGFYTHDPAEEGAAHDGKRMMVAVRSTQLQDPMSLVATLAHELGHVILLGGDLMDPQTPDHEPITDLLTVFLGLGIFTANSAGRFLQYQDDTRHGWSMQRLGYLPEEAFGYALARFAIERGEDRPEWVRHLSTNIKAYYKHSRAYLEKNAPPAITAKPIN